MAGLSIKVKGTPLSTLGAVANIKFGTSEHGPESITWTMNRSFRHPIMQGNALVECFDGGFRIGSGTLVEPAGDGTYAARGSWMQAQNVLCVDGAGNASLIPDTVLVTAINVTGELPWALAASVSASAWGTPSANVVTLDTLLNGIAAEQGKRWVVGPTPVTTGTRAATLRMASDPVTPNWIVPRAVYGRNLTPAEDEFYTHLVGRYLDSATSTYKSVTVGSAPAAAAFGRRTRPIDLSDMGATTSTRATAVLTGMFNRVGPRMGFGETLDLTFGQITKLGGTPAPLTQITNGQMVRLAGTIDVTRPGRIAGYTDIVIAGTEYDQGAKSIRIIPQGYAPRDFDDILDAAIAAAA